MSEQQPRFRLLRRGYDRFEVDRVLDHYEAQLSENQERLTAYQNQINQVQSQLELFKEKYNQLQKQVLTKEKAAAQVHQLALKESNSIIETAHKNADLIVDEALSTARIILMELSKMTNQTNQVKEDLRKYVNNLSVMIDDVDLPEIPNLDWLFENKKIKGDE